MSENNELLLITYANKLYRDKFESIGFNITEFVQPLEDASAEEFSSSFNGTAVIEIIEESMERLEDIIDNLKKNTTRIIAISANINDVYKKYFFRHGIAEVIESRNAGRIADYIRKTSNIKNKKYGKIIILEDNTRRLNILNTVITRFNYSPVIVNSMDKLFKEITGINIQLILINLGTKDFEISSFVKQSFSSKQIKKTPVIPYKNMDEGLFIHEMISGLNKITKVILSVEEIFSFLVDILFRKELSPGLNLLNETVDFNNLKVFITEPVSRLCNIMGTDIFQMEKILTEENIEIINGRIESLQNLIIKTDGLRWLIKNEPESGKIQT